MKAIFLGLLFLILFHAGKAQADTTVIEIPDISLLNINYYQVDFPKPTKIVFTNLLRVDEEIIFYNNNNLIEVDFPLLDSCGGFFQFNSNSTLRKINAPVLHTVTDLLSVIFNTSLTTLNICDLQRILSSPSNPFSHEINYQVHDNTPAVDATLPCFSHGAPQNLSITRDTIRENLPANTLVGNFTVTSNATDSIVYFFTTFNNQFYIQGNSLFSKQSFDFETGSSYDFTVVAMNQFGEKTYQAFLINIVDIAVEDTTLLVITDATVQNINYNQASFTQPTKIVYTNLVNVNGNTTIHNAVNLVAIDFPMLDSCGGYFSIQSNLSLQRLNCPGLRTVTDYLKIIGNSSLTLMNICGLQQILLNPMNPPPDPFADPVLYSITGNTPAIDVMPPCFSSGAPTNLNLSNTSIAENMPPNSVVGDVSFNAGVNDHVSLQLSQSFGDNDAFLIQDKKLLAGQAFDFETKDNYTIEIKASNQFGETTKNIFLIHITDDTAEDTVTVEINDSNLASVQYLQASFTKPTRLVFPNLVYVAGAVNFFQCTNLVSIQFPLLDSCGGFFKCVNNPSLQKVSAPKLVKLSDVLNISGNPVLTEIDVCNVAEITQTIPWGEPGHDPFYSVSSNDQVDYGNTCFRKTNIIYIPENNIIPKPAPNTYIGHFVSDASAATDSIRYYFADANGAEITDSFFVIRGDSVFLAKEFSSYTDTTFNFDINAIRSTRSANRNAQATSTAALNEKIVLDLNMNVFNTLHYSSSWTGSGLTPASSAWSNPANWSTGAVPDAYTDVIIDAGNVTVNTNIICRSITIMNGANVNVLPGFIVNVMH